MLTVQNPVFPFISRDVALHVYLKNLSVASNWYADLREKNWQYIVQFSWFLVKPLVVKKMDHVVVGYEKSSSLLKQPKTLSEDYHLYIKK